MAALPGHEMKAASLADPPGTGARMQAPRVARPYFTAVGVAGVAGGVAGRIASRAALKGLPVYQLGH